MLDAGLQMLRELPDSREDVSYVSVFADLHPPGYTLIQLKRRCLISDRFCVYIINKTTN